MTLTLRIENIDRLEDGGPTSFVLDGKGGSAGRKRGMDWVLPDPGRFISGHHFDVVFRDGGYWLHDLSSNGTYLQGESHRIQGEHRLAHGEHIVVGHYIIAVDLSGAMAAAPPGRVAPAPGQTWALQPPPDEADPWDLGSGQLQPVNPLPRPGGGAHALDDMGQDFIPLQRPGFPPAGPPPDQPGMLQQPGTGAKIPAPGWQPPPARPPGTPAGSPYTPQARTPVPDDNAYAPPPVIPEQDRSLPHLPPPRETQAPLAEPMPPNPPVPQPVETGFPRAAAPYGGGDPHAVLRAFCEGAGLDIVRAEGVDPESLARELGAAVRVVTEEIMRMLGDRAEVKRFTRGGERTMRSAQGNSPLKFLTTRSEALEAMFLHPREGFMAGTEAFSTALADLRRHQMAVFAALQPALAEVLEGLSPDEIEAEAKSHGHKLGPSRRGRNWDLFTKRWDQHAQAGENGMLDAFLVAFARYYADVEQGGEVET